MWWCPHTRDFWKDLFLGVLALTGINVDSLDSLLAARKGVTVGVWKLIGSLFYKAARKTLECADC